MTFNFSSVLLLWFSFCSGLILISSQELTSKDPVCALQGEYKGVAPKGTCSFLLLGPREPPNSPYKFSFAGIDSKCTVSTIVYSNATTDIYHLMTVTPKSNGAYVLSSDETIIDSKRNTYKGRFLTGEPNNTYEGIYLRSNETDHIAYTCRDNNDIHYSKTQSLLLFFSVCRNKGNSSFDEFYEFAREKNITTNGLVPVDQTGCPEIPKDFCEERACQ